MHQPNNQVLLEKINNLHEKIDNLREELRDMKIAEDRNTEFRNKATGVVAIVGTIAGFIGGLVLWVISKIWK